MRTARLGSLLRGRAEDPLLRSAYSLMMNVVMTSALGVGFWVVAARLFAPADVGRDSALVSAMTVVSTICALNLGSALLRFLPVTKMSPHKVVLGAYAVTTAVSLLGASAFVLLAPTVSPSYGYLRHDVILSLLWVTSVVAWGVFALQDSVMTALRRAPWVPVENTAFGVLKFAALPLLLTIGSAHAIFIAWTIPMILLLVPVNYLIFRRLIPTRPVASGEPSPVEQLGWRGLGRYFAGDYGAMIFTQASSTLLPVLVVAMLGSRAGAYFYMPFTIVNAFSLLFLQIFTSMTVEAAMAPARLSELMTVTVRRFGGLLTVGCLILVIGAHLILLPFGPHYVHAGAQVLRLMACAAPFRAAVDLYSAVCRVEARVGRMVCVQAALFATINVLAIVLGQSIGMTGVGLAWLLGNALAGAAVLPSLTQRLRRRRPRLVPIPEA